MPVFSKTTDVKDPVFPGENCFFYWKTSPSLWESKLTSYSGVNPIFVPINWTFHTLSQDSFDFGTNRPETDLKRLSNIAFDLGREIVFLTPITPVPFLPNGGIPSHVAKTVSTSNDFMTYAVVDSEYHINKIFSFFDPKVYQAFRKFVWNLGQYLSQNGISNSVYAMRSGYIKDGEYFSYMNDTSKAYDEGLTRFLKQKANQNNNTNESEPQKLELQNKWEFTKLIDELYLQSASECLSSNWGGVLNFSFLGGAPEDIFMRSSETWEHYSYYFKPLFDTLMNNVIPSSILLTEEIKSSILTKSLNDSVTDSFIKKYLDISIFEDDFVTTFSPLTLFDIYTHPIDHLVNYNPWVHMGLKSFFDNNFKWSYCYSKSIEEINEDAPIIEKIFFYYSSHLDMASFSKILQLFMNGAKICLDISNLHPDLERKLELFIKENSIELEMIKYHTSISNAKLGEGNLLLFEGDKIKELDSSKKNSFWDNLINYMDIKSFSIEAEQDLYYFIKTRSPKGHELNFEEIRRISFYNPTSYKKKAKINPSKNFAFLKYIDAEKTTVKSSPVGIDIEMLPGGHVSLDFGHYE